MNHTRKNLKIITIITVLLIFTLPFTGVGASAETSQIKNVNSNMPANPDNVQTPDVIYKTSSIENVTSGATLERITKFTINGWLNINVLRVDMSNPNIKIDTLSNIDSLKIPTSAKTLAQSHGAVAAINAGFFNWVKGNGTVWIYPDGPVVKSGTIVTAASDFNRYQDSMATFSINNLNRVLFDYWKTDIYITAPDGNSIAISRYNKHSSNYNDYTVIDKNWGAASIGASEAFPDIVEMVVSDGIVSEIRQGMPPVQIPQNGFVVITRQGGNKLFNKYFKVGYKAGLIIKTNPDWYSLKTAITGSAMLLKDGKIPEKFSVDTINKQPNPRTAVGSTQNGSQLILVTVDGKQDSSTGMTLNSMAALMLELGAYNALNLDGGGSTTMAERTPGTNTLKVVNNPSDGLPRGISTAIGIFSTALPSQLKGLIIGTVDSNIFVNTSREFTVRGYDKYFNPVEVKPEQVKWGFLDVQGQFAGNTFYPKSVGEGRISASVGGVSAICPISVLSSPVLLDLSEKTINIPLNKTVKFTVEGKNKNGYSGFIDPKDVKWAVTGGIGTFNGNTFTASGQGTGYIDALIGDTHAYCSISVALESTAVRDAFEVNNGTFLSYPDIVQGKYEISTEQKHSGTSSGKLTYDFTYIEGSRAVYMVYPNDGIPLESNATKIGLWVYNDHINSNWLSAEILDSSGNKNRLYFAKNLDWIGWKYVELSLTDVILPTKLARIYLVQTSPVSDSGSIYIDDLTVMASGFPPIDAAGIPMDTVPTDAANVKVPYQSRSDSMRFSVFGQSHEPGNLLEKLLMIRLSEKVNNFLEAAAFVGSSSHDAVGMVEKPAASANTGYASFDVKSNRFINLDVCKGGLRTSDSKQWSWFLQQLDTAAGNNIFIFLTGSPENFNDKMEAGLFQDILTKNRQKTGKNIWVFCKGDKNTSYMERGIKYFTTAGYDVEGLTPSNTDEVKYILVTVMGNSVTFEFKPIV